VPRLPDEASGHGALPYARAVADRARDAGDDPVVVAHSASGLMLPVVASLRRVRRMVFLAAVIPRIGQSFIDWFGAERDAMFHPEWIGQDPSTDDDAAVRFILHDCPPNVARWGLTVRSPWYPREMY
jgi:hypothetical protein